MRNAEDARWMVVVEVGVKERLSIAGNSRSVKVVLAVVFIVPSLNIH